MKKKRLYTVLKIFVLLIFIMLGRMFQIQFFQGSRLSEAAYSQRLINLELEKLRGNILDRNDIPFTNREKKVLVVLMPLYLKNRMEDIKKICEVLNLDFNSLKNDILTGSEPIMIETDVKTADNVKSMSIHGVTLLYSLERYSESTACHVVGYLRKADMVGEAGIEKFYENILKYDNENSVAIITDAKRNPLQGYGYRMIASEDKKRLNIRLTLDYHIQRTVSEILDEYGVKGAVVIIEVNTGDIVAMVSKPDFDQNNVGNFLESPNNELFNKAVASYSPGSIFKIIDAAVLFESGRYVSDRYYCNGAIRLGDREFKCYSYKDGGHGLLGLENAFALSCNTYFINMGINLGPVNIIEMAALFGFGRKTGIYEQGVDESAGNLPFIDRYFTDGDTANISIGQGEILATPLQVANMIAIIANDGIKNKLNIVDAVVDSNGNKVRNLRSEEGHRIISKSTSDRLKLLMEHVTQYGTGIKANIKEYGGAGGKTGSAESGQVLNGEKVIHAWFAGYFPKTNPKYAVCVFAENGKSGGDVAAPIFADIAREILFKGY